MTEQIKSIIQTLNANQVKEKSQIYMPWIFLYVVTDKSYIYLFIFI